jgi:hypothetical protein
MPEALRFPRGVRFARKDEVPRSSHEAVERIAGARITTGFVSKASPSAAFSTYFEANVHADEVWTVFERLAASLLPDIAAPLIGWKDADATLGPYTDKLAALSVFLPHKESLQHDGYIEFGLMFQTDEVTEEIFVKAAKYFQIWTNQPDIAEAALAAAGVPKVGGLQFIDEFPRVTERLTDAPGSEETISAIASAFRDLPPK